MVDLAEAVKSRGLKLVYGGGSWGLMGTTAQRAHELGVEIIGVVPEFMKATAGATYGHTEWVPTMAERKARMAEIVPPMLSM